MKKLLALSLLVVACGGGEPASAPPVTSAPAPTASAPAPPPVSTAPAVPAVTGPTLLPVDEATSDPSLVAFRTALLDAVRRRDANAVAGMADPKIRTSFGGGGGVAEFRRELAKADSPLWDQLEQISTHGGSFQKEGTDRRFWAPYVYSAWPEERDAFTSLAVLGDNVPLRSAADPSAPVLATLRYDIVELVQASGETPAGFKHVRTADGKEGWVAADAVRSPIAHRAGIVQKNGAWKIEAVVAGD